MSSALDIQVGGAHYKKFALQPVEFCHKHRLGYIKSCFVKYIARHSDKNGAQDLQKCLHYLDLLKELRAKHPPRWWEFWKREPRVDMREVREFTDQLPAQEALAVCALVLDDDLTRAANHVRQILHRRYALPPCR